ncbi:MAG: DNA-processing protein DprA, partial [Planctomycetes bacterium]|nr:DNA-processing protein DprA [Planctomycetota bacterium]
RGRAGAVLGNGLPEIYPPEHAALADRLAAAGGFLLTEYPPHTPPLRRHFPARNRLISALAQAVVVVQAGLRSGSLITVGWALEQGRDVFVYPGPTDGPHYTGCHKLIREGATLVTCAADLLESLAAPLSRNLSAEPPPIDPRLAEGAASPEEIMERTGLSASLALRAWVRRAETG